jgi:hypothetical protein
MEKVWNKSFDRFEEKKKMDRMQERDGLWDEPRANASQRASKIYFAAH